MDIDRFARLALALSARPSRRVLGRTFAGLTAGSIFAPLRDLSTGQARKRKKPKKKCKGGKKKCGKSCVDVKTDANNCGGCGKQCAAGQACEQGTCPGGACDALVNTVQQLKSALETAESRNDFTICLEAGTYDLPPQFHVPAPEPWNLRLPGGVTLLGAGAAQTILKGSGSGYGVIGSHFPAHLAGLTVTGGESFGLGGGISNAAELTLTDCVVSGNSAQDGGGIYNAVGSGETLLALVGCTISENTAHRETNNGHGGGIYNLGVVTRTNTTISGNISDEGPDCFNGSGGTGC